MALAMPSRFACLKIEGEDTSNTNSQMSKNKKAQGEQKTQPPKKPGSAGDKGDKGAKKSSSKTSNNAPQGGKREKKSGKKEQTQQWEEWKQRDNDLVDGYFEKDLQSAIMLSKLDYEQNKTHQSKIIRTGENGPQKKKQQSKNKTMSLDQFNVLVSSGPQQQNKAANGATKATDGKADDERFFETLDEDAKRELNRDQNIEKRKAREANIEEIITLAQCQEKLQAQVKENERLRGELDKAKQEIITVKTRNKTLCSILGHGEMKDKADVLMELERLGHVKDELTEEVARLHALLEQERSKVATLTSEQHKHKEKARKKHGV